MVVTKKKSSSYSLNQQGIIVFIKHRVSMSKVAILFCVLMPTGNAYAYLDPATGSIVLQGIIAGIVGGWFVIKSYWHRIKAFFLRNNESEQDNRRDHAHKLNGAEKNEKQPDKDSE